MRLPLRGPHAEPGRAYPALSEGNGTLASLLEGGVHFSFAIVRRDPLVGGPRPGVIICVFSWLRSGFAQSPRCAVRAAAFAAPSRRFPGRRVRPARSGSAVTTVMQYVDGRPDSLLPRASGRGGGGSLRTVASALHKRGTRWLASARRSSLRVRPRAHPIGTFAR